MRVLTLLMLIFFVALAGWASKAEVVGRNSFLTSCAKYDEYGALAYEEERPRLDAYAGKIKEEPGATAVITMYPGGKLSFQEAQARARKVIDYLVNERETDADHIGIMILKKTEPEFVTELELCPYFPPEDLRGMFDAVVILGKDVKKDSSERKGD